MEIYDLIILGAGSAGEWFADNLATMKIAIVEEGLIGGECPYFACMPSKVMLKAVGLRKDTIKAGSLGLYGGVSPEEDAYLAYLRATEIRFDVVDGLSDVDKEAAIRRSGATLLRGHGVIEGANRLKVIQHDGTSTTIGWEKLVISTGSTSVIPKIEGLDEIEYWTSQDALTTKELPDELLILGGGPIGIELAEIFASFGSQVTLIEAEPHLLPREDAHLGELVRAELSDFGINVLVNTRVIKVAKTPTSKVEVIFGDGTTAVGSRLIVAVGKRARLDGIGLETLGIDPRAGRIVTDEYCRVKGVENVFAAGDVTGVAALTHTANYQARLIINYLLGTPIEANYEAIPRAVYCHPPIAAVGLNEADARERCGNVKTSDFAITNTARALTEGLKRGHIKLIMDEDTKTLLGAWIYGDQADELIGELTLAIRAKIPIDLLAQVVHPFPTYSEATEPPYRALSSLS